MAIHAWTQDVPINEPIYREIVAHMGAAEMPGLLIHLAVEAEDGTLRYIDVWESEEACDKAFANVIHPAVFPVLEQHGIRPSGEPPRTPVKVIDVRYANGTSRS